MNITHEQLGLALREQKQTGDKLGEVLVRLGMLSQCRLDEVLAFQKNQDKTLHTYYRLGEMLIEAGYSEPYHSGHTLLSAALVAMLSLSTVPDAQAAGSSGSGSASAKVLVTASVMPSTSLRIIRQPHELVVTNADKSRGYVEAKAASLIEVKSNTANGCLISFKGISEPFKEVFVQGLGKEFQISSGAGWIHRPYTKGAVATELSYRFILFENTEPGTYAWPLSISVQPL